MTNDVAAFGPWLRACRRSARMSQEQLAERSGLSIRAISNLERSRTQRPHPDSVRRLADALHLRDQGRAQFIAAAGLRAAVAPAAAALDDRPSRDGSVQVIPRQLPAPVRLFGGRKSELAELTALLDDAGALTPAAVIISTIEGTAGVGKTALAVHWAHQAANRFPDGQLYVSLRGFDPSQKPVSPADAIRDLLDALQVPAERIPATLDAQAALYRSLLADKRMLVVLDNARDAQQVRPLLPGSPGCLVVITSRSQLAGLAATEGAHTLTLDLLTGAEACELLALRLGAARVGAEPEAAAELVRLCARLPLALAITAARAAARPGLGLDALAGELKDAQQILDALDTGDPLASVRTVFSWSLNSLAAPAARMFGLLGLHPGPDITIPAAASLAGIPLSQARRTLRELAEAHLVTEHTPGRFGLHDLLRAYAAEQEAEPERRAAVQRMLDHYLHTAHAAALLLRPFRDLITLAPARPGVTPERMNSFQNTLDWFDAERHVLISAVTLAAGYGCDTYAWQLSWAMTDFLDWRAHWHEWAAIQRIALAAAMRLDDPAARAAARLILGQASARFGDYDQAGENLTDCLRLYRQLGDQAGEARTHRFLLYVAEHQGRYADALGHAEQALALYQAMSSPLAQADALNDVGWCHAHLGDYQRARGCCRQALVLHRRLGDRRGEAHTWDSLGYAEHQLGRHAQATVCYQHALSLSRELGDRFSEADVLTHLGDLYHTAGDQREARDAWQRALGILNELRHPDAAQVRAKLREGGARDGQPRQHEPERTLGLGHSSR